MAKPKLFIVNDYGCHPPWAKTFDKTHEFKDADCIMFTGGEDINPAIYHEKEGDLTGYINRERDVQELGFFHRARDRMLPMIGICRGAQLVCAVSGGKLIQHIHHPSRHTLYTHDGEKFIMNSVHHQMMWPINVKHKLIAWTEKLSPDYLSGSGESLQAFGDGREPEVVYFEDSKALGIQGHPEWMPLDCASTVYYNKLVKELLL